MQVRCIECDVPRYEPLKLDKYYKVASQSFIANGGDGYSVSSIYCEMRVLFFYALYNILCIIIC